MTPRKVTKVMAEAATRVICQKFSVICWAPAGSADFNRAVRAILRAALSTPTRKKGGRR